MSLNRIATGVALVCFALGGLTSEAASSFCQLPGQSGFLRSSTWGDDLRLAENVAVPTRISVERVRWWGIYVEGVTLAECSSLPTDEFVIRIYEDDGAGLPGTLIHESVGLTGNRQATGQSLTDVFTYAEYEYDASLSPPVTLTPGINYWLSIYAIDDDSDNCYWAWEAAPGDGSAAELRGATEPWEARTGDFAYCLVGNVVPTLTAWGVFAMTLLLLAAGTVVLRRGRTSARHAAA